MHDFVLNLNNLSYFQCIVKIIGNILNVNTINDNPDIRDTFNLKKIK
jgi:hypothetical protein